MSEKPMLKGVAVEEGRRPWEMEVGKPRNPHRLSEQDGVTKRWRKRNVTSALSSETFLGIDANHDLVRIFVDRNHPVVLDGFCGALCAASHQRSRWLARGVEGFGRDPGIEEELSTEVHCETKW